MQLYAGTTREFVHAATHNAIAQRLADAFLAQYRYRSGDPEFDSWQNSLRALSSVIQAGRLEDNGVLLEYQLPLSSLRLDALLKGSSGDGEHAVIVELKPESMNRRIPDGAWALFMADQGGSRQGKVVLAQRQDQCDPEGSASYTLKQYDACRTEGPDGIRYTSVTLRPNSTDGRYQPIEIDLDDPDAPRIIAILVSTLV